jgi:nitrogen fixation/metabolism regulation signal transduction histidine kinase
MASEPIGRLDLLSAGGWRLLFAGCLAYGLAAALGEGRYLVGIVLGSALILTGVDSWRAIARPASGSAARSASDAIEKRRLHEATALLDAVTVALFALDAYGRVRFTNRAARALAGCDVARLQDAAAIGSIAAQTILALPIGGRQLVALADGCSALVWVEGISRPGIGLERLVSVQSVAGELDAVQVGAWHSMSRVLAHEIMNSLTPIASLSESVERQAEAMRLPVKVAGALATIARRSRHLMGFVERYRAVVDLPRPQPAEIDALAFMEDLEALAGPVLVNAGADIVVERPEPGLTLVADRALLEQAVLNLLKNAAEAVASQAQGRVELACTRSPDGARIAVCDNGPGVPTERLEEVFVPFFTTKAQGGGVGLSLARQIASAHGGRLMARRNDGPGMTFEIFLPSKS